MTDEGALEVSKIKSLRLLNLSHVKMSAKRLEYLQDLPKLQVLHLLSCDIDDQMIKTIARLKHLKSLTLDSNWRITYDGLQPLNSMKIIVSLNVCPRITDVEKLKTILPDCRCEISGTP
ncbi:MAG: hypothetical protein K8F91_03900 [Candidatus Obscuribacterales bacterium]|nr:hypothetical protein [Candidatus Obscuribacterales bacterium]